MANYWWVNQNQTYAHEVRGGYLWSPKFRADGARNQFYENMTRVQPGDVIFSYCDTFIKAIGVATSLAASVPKPTAFGRTGSYWSAEGWFVEVQFRELASPIRPREHMRVLEPTLPTKYSPLRPSGEGGQHVYLAEVPLPMAHQLMMLLGQEGQQLIDALEIIAKYEIAQSFEEAELEDRTDIAPTEKLQLAKARVGQGLFKSRVELVEKCCRITKVKRPEHLTASHIKPWRVSSDRERLDGNNGLLLAPHIDHLFDRGLISFTLNGRILVSPVLAPDILERWSIDADQNVGVFSSEQSEFLEYHSDVVLRH